MDRYLRPESHSRVTTVLPAASLSATCSAATTLPPDDVPAKKGFFFCQPSRHRLGTLGRDKHGVVGYVVTPQWRHKTGTDTIDLVRTGRSPSQDGRLGGHHVLESDERRIADRICDVDFALQWISPAS